MAAKVLFWFDPRSYALMDTFVCHFGLSPVVVDPDNVFRRGQMPEAYDTLDQAKAANPGHTWVWMCARGGVPLDEFSHPAGDVIYAFGHNVDGMGPEFDAEEGPKVSLRGPERHWDYVVAPQVLYDRQLYLSGRRR